MWRAVALVLLCALSFAPVAISVTHGPDAVASAMLAVTAKAANGHSHDWDEPGKSGQHDAADHEHNIAFVSFGAATRFSTSRQQRVRANVVFPRACRVTAQGDLREPASSDRPSG